MLFKLYQSIEHVQKLLNSFYVDFITFIPKSNQDSIHIDRKNTLIALNNISKILREHISKPK